MKQENFKKGMLILRDTFPERFGEMDKSSVNVWFQLLHDIEDKAFEKAILFVARNHEKPPTPATIRRIANNGDTPLTGEEAWSQVTAALRSYGYLNPPSFDDPALDRAVKALGWSELSMASLSQLPTWRAHFFRTYDAMRKRVEADEEMVLIAQLQENRPQLEV